MYIVNKKQLMKLKTPFVYSNYTPCIIEGLSVCIDNSLNNDFIYESLLDQVIPLAGYLVNLDDGDIGYFKLLHDAEDNGTHFQADLNCSTRDSKYEDNDLYVIYENDDIRKLIIKLNGILPMEDRICKI